MTTLAGAPPNCAGWMAIGAAMKLAKTPMSPINSTFASVCFAAGTGAGALFTDRAQQHLLAQHPIWQVSPTGALATGQTDAGKRVVAVKSAASKQTASAIRVTSK